jgi:hypoxanthine phosphoribosyltransferase
LSAFPDAIVVATETEVERAYQCLAAELQRFVSDGNCILIGIMMGGMIPMVRLAGVLSGDFAMDYCQVSRYRGAEQGGELEWLQAPHLELAEQTVLLVDDIYDEGVTLEYVTKACYSQGAARVVSAVLVQKQHERRAGRTRPDFVGLSVADQYVFGCGMDYRQRWRNLPAIYAIREPA